MRGALRLPSPFRHSACLAPRQTVSEAQRRHPDRGTRPFVSPITLQQFTIRSGRRKNLSKVAARGGHRELLVLQGTMTLSSRNGSRHKLAAGTRVDGRQLAKNPFVSAALNRFGQQA
jgi:hypothetical protein